MQRWIKVLPGRNRRSTKLPLRPGLWDSGMTLDRRVQRDRAEHFKADWQGKIRMLVCACWLGESFLCVPYQMLGRPGTRRRQPCWELFFASDTASSFCIIMTLLAEMKEGLIISEESFIDPNTGADFSWHNHLPKCFIPWCHRSENRINWNWGETQKFTPKQ